MGVLLQRHGMDENVLDGCWSIHGFSSDKDWIGWAQIQILVGIREILFEIFFARTGGFIVNLSYLEPLFFFLHSRARSRSYYFEILPSLKNYM